MLYHAVTRNTVRRSGRTVPRRGCDSGNKGSSIALVQGPVHVCTVFNYTYVYVYIYICISINTIYGLCMILSW